MEAKYNVGLFQLTLEDVSLVEAMILSTGLNLERGRISLLASSAPDNKALKQRLEIIDKMLEQIDGILYGNET